MRVPTRPTGITGTSQPRLRRATPGLPLVEAGVRRPGALGVDGEHPARSQDRGGGVERPLRGVASAPVHGDLAGGPEEPRRLPAVEVLGLGHVGDPAADHQGQEERVAERLVVGGQDHRSRRWGRARAPRPSPATAGTRNGADDRLHDPVGHEATVSVRVLYCTDDGERPHPAPSGTPPAPPPTRDPGRSWAAPSACPSRSAGPPSGGCSTWCRPPPPSASSTRPDSR